MKYLFLPLLWVCLSLAPVAAQTPAETLETAVKGYNAVSTFIDGLTTETVTDADVATVKSRMETGLGLLDQVIRTGEAGEILTARYFRLNFEYKYAFVLGMKGQSAPSLVVMQRIEREMGALKEADFPLRYVFEGKNFVIQWQNFAATQAEYYTGYGEVAYYEGYYEDAARISRLGLAHVASSAWTRYVAANKLLDIYDKRPALFNYNEAADMAFTSIQLYDVLNETEKETVAKYNYPKVRRGIQLLLNQAQNNPSATLVDRCAEGAALAGRYERESAKVLQLYEIAYLNKYIGQLPIHQSAIDYARTMRATDNTRAGYVALAAIGRMVSATSETDCEGLRTIASLSGEWGLPELQRDYNKQADKCLADEQKAAKKASQYARRGSSGFNLYVGAHLLPMLNKNGKRDYGGVVNFVFNNTALELSYTQVNRNKENIFDLWIREVDDADQDNISPWDGFKAYIQPKFMEDGGPIYVGLLLGYAQKQFDPMTVSVTDDLTGMVNQAVFEPNVTQYMAIVNLGTMPLVKGFGMDLFYGFGANYSIFDPGNNLDRDLFTIDNPLLEHRKSAYWGFVMRLGLTIGLNFGNGNK